jgi:glutamine---fructose-6-phosphate transaminase (isomerizing)
MMGRGMRRDMEEGPAVLGRLVGRADATIERLRSAVPDGARGIALVARGSSDRAALYGRYLLEIATGLPIVLTAPSLYTRYGIRSTYEGFVTVAISQSGRTPEIIRVTELLRSSGSFSIVMTSDAASPLAAAGEVALDLGAGPEIAVPATKTVVAELMTFALLAQALGKVTWAASELRGLPEAAATILEDWAGPASAAERLRSNERLVTIGRGYLFSAAMETALKLEEAALVLTEGYSAADFRHGPIALLRRGVPLIAFMAPGPVEGDVASIAEEAEARGGDVVRVSPAEGSDLPLPPVAEALSPIIAVIRGHQLAWSLAVARGLDPDQPAGLTKVTDT